MAKPVARLSRSVGNKYFYCFLLPPFNLLLVSLEKLVCKGVWMTQFIEQGTEQEEQMEDILCQEPLTSLHFFKLT